MRKLFWLPILLALAVYLLAPLPGRSAPLQDRIESKRAQVDAKKRREGVLTTTISGYDTRISGLQGEINGVQRRLSQVQGELDRERLELAQVRDDLEVARDQLERARSKLRAGRAALADRLVELYKADQPDALTVVLEADGFDDLLERTEFLERISQRDRSIVERVRKLKRDAEREERRLGELEQRKEDSARAILERRDDISSAKSRLVSAQGELRTVRDDRRGALAQVRDGRQRLEGDLRELEAAQARVTRQLRGSVAPWAPAGPIKPGSGNLIYPVNGAIVSPFGMRWGRLHAGIDIAAPAGTPIRAAYSGTVVLMGPVSGYGNYICVRRVGGRLSACYAHLSSFATTQGARVRQGQVIGAVGCTGHCFGDHLHFETRVNGTPQNPMGYL